ncbi:unnamed protein product [Pedinophyceae sp. YPF-701]|nr:unnamed protein product [Pedinophyceae sp. YPF-701]
MADDFEKAVLICFDQHGRYERGWKDQAETFLSNVRENPQCLELCCERYSTTDYPEVQFWCARTLHEAITSCDAGTGPPLPAAARTSIRAAVYSWAQHFAQGGSQHTPAFVANKVVQLLVAVAAKEFPDGTWASFFSDVLSWLPAGPPAIDMLCRVLRAVDGDVVSLEIPRSPRGARRSMEFKDAMRERAAPALARAWLEIVRACHAGHPDSAADVLETARLYVSWMDIALVTGDSGIAELALTLAAQGGPAATERLRAAALDFISEVCAKRMEPVAKLQLVSSLGVVARAQSWGPDLLCPPASGGDSDLPAKVGALLGSVANEILSAWRSVENSVRGLHAVGLAVDDAGLREAEAACALARSLLSGVFPSLLAAMRHPNEDVGPPVLPFFHAWVTRVRKAADKGEAVSADDVELLKATLAAAAERAVIPRDFVEDDVSATALIAGDDGEALAERRRELFTLFKGVARVAPALATDLVAGLLRQIMAPPGSPGGTPQECELALSLLFNLGEIAPEGSLELTDSDGASESPATLGDLVVALMRSPVPHLGSSRLVTIAVLECYVRYVKVLQRRQECIPNVLSAFYDAGLSCECEAVSTRACYLFMRLVKPLRQNVGHYLPRMLSSLEPIILRILRTPRDPTSTLAPSKLDHGIPGLTGGMMAPQMGSLPSATDDRLYIFEALGYLIGHEGLPEEEQKSFMKAILGPLVSQIQGALGQGLAPTDTQGTVAVQHALVAVQNFSKGFAQNLTNTLRPETGSILCSVVDVALTIPTRAPRHRELSARVVNFFHRMVECLGPRILPQVSQLLVLLMAPDNGPEECCDGLGLLSQLATRFKGAMLDAMTGSLPLVISRVHELLPASWDWSGAASTPIRRHASAEHANGTHPGFLPVGSSEEQRLLGEVQRAYYTLLLGIVNNSQAGALSQIDPSATQACLEALFTGSSQHVDPTMRKPCLQALVALASDWAEQPSPPAGLQELILERIARDACLRGLLSGTLDPRDAGVFALTVEAASALRMVHAMAAEQLQALVSRDGVALMGQDGAMALAAALTEGDAKKVRNALRAAMPKR